MVEICRNKLSSHGINMQFEFLSGGEGEKILHDRKEYYDLIITNSVLHHLVDLGSFFQLVNELLKVDGMYIVGHEPHKLFYINGSIKINH